VFGGVGVADKLLMFLCVITITPILLSSANLPVLVSQTFSELHLFWYTTGILSSTDPQANSTYTRLPICIIYVSPIEKAGHSHAGSKHSMSKHFCNT